MGTDFLDTKFRENLIMFTFTLQTNEKKRNKCLFVEQKANNWLYKSFLVMKWNKIKFNNLTLLSFSYLFILTTLQGSLKGKKKRKNHVTIELSLQCNDSHLHVVLDKHSNDHMCLHVCGMFVRTWIPYRSHKSEW